MGPATFDYDQLRALEAIVRRGGFERAAAALNLTQSAVSQRIRSLEEQIGAPVLLRTAPPKATAMGNELLGLLESVGKLESECRLRLGDKSHEETWKTIAIGVNADSLSTWFLDALAETILSDRILLSLVVENEDLTQELMRRGEVIGCVTSTAHPLAGCEAVSLGEMRYQCVASPRFIRRFFPEGFTLEALSRAPAVLFNHSDRVHERFLQKVFPRASIQFPFHLVPSSEGFAGVVARGLAYGVVPSPQAEPLIKKGRLRTIHPEHEVKIRLYWHYPRNESKSVRMIRLNLMERSKKVLTKE